MVTKFFEVIELCKCAHMRLCVHARVRAVELCERARECVPCARVFLRVYLLYAYTSVRVCAGAFMRCSIWLAREAVLLLPEVVEDSAHAPLSRQLEKLMASVLNLL